MSILKTHNADRDTSDELLKKLSTEWDAKVMEMHVWQFTSAGSAWPVAKFDK